jgi:glyoxylase-like metal-dependent hydrolase (beta-lactamase superfamily II)
MPHVAQQTTFPVGNNIQVTFVNDGVGRTHPDTFLPPPEGMDWSRHKQYLDEDGMVVHSMGGFLIETHGQKVLVDLGLGNKRIEPGEIPGFGLFEGGPLLDNLRAAGCGPEDIDRIVYTHLHLDHIGWTSRLVSGMTGTRWALTFPHASYTCPRAEWEFWAAMDHWAGPQPEEHKALLENRIHFSEDGETVAPGVTLMATPGHTPGHSAVVVADGAERLFILGDAVICPVQLTHSEWGAMTEVDAALARKSRDMLIEQLERSDSSAACSHFTDFAFGRLVRAEGKRYWSPHS